MINNSSNPDTENSAKYPEYSTSNVEKSLGMKPNLKFIQSVIHVGPLRGLKGSGNLLGHRIASLSKGRVSCGEEGSR